jgi:hypothetical protein
VTWLLVGLAWCLASVCLAIGFSRWFRWLRDGKAPEVKR